MVLLNSDDILHAVEAGGLAHQPFGGPQGASRERNAVGGAVRDLDALAAPGKGHRMLADDIARAQHGESNAARFARGGTAVPIEHAKVLERRAARSSNRL